MNKWLKRLNECKDTWFESSRSELFRNFKLSLFNGLSKVIASFGIDFHLLFMEVAIYTFH